MWLTGHIGQRERALRLKYTTGLDDDELDELTEQVERLLTEPWNKPTGRPRKLSLRKAVAVTCGYQRQNVIQEVLGEMFGVSQETVSPLITFIVPLVAQATRPFVPTEQEAVERVTGQVCLLDGSLDPCWSYAGHDQLWAGKHATTGHNFQGITDLRGNICYGGDPRPGSVHDSATVKQTPVAGILAHASGVIADKGYQGCGYLAPRKKPRGGELSVGDKRGNANLSRLRAPVERAIVCLKSWRVLHADYRRPYRTHLTSFRATVGLF